ncbi:nuclear transport factor 2 family protein [Thalassobacillus hwangdonensis]|uniref:Nuclear transport factor 2 family protein n=1 Tax=Thalassobacillus hwangdonensis TaxID=546108 RepID=A0ABW3L4U6_9BACI
MGANSEEKGIKISSPVDCDNAPKKKILKEFITAFATKDYTTIIKNSTEDISWTIVNDFTVQGTKEVTAVLDKRITKKIKEVDILNMITHGKTAAVNGTIQSEDNTNYSFCNVYTFKSAGKNTIKDITTYIIKMD